MITIVTCTYNNLSELKVTLESISHCNHVSITVINGSTLRQVEDYLKDIQRKEFTVVNEPDRGIYDAFNKGWKNASGEYICYTNSGDLLINESGYLEKSEQFLILHPEYDFVHGNILFVHDELGALRMKPSGKNIGYGMPFLHPSMVVRKNVFEKLNGFNEDYKIAGDYDFVVRMLNAGLKGHYIPLTVNKMDGTGVSKLHEWAAIKECKRSLIDNNLFFGEVRSGYYIRCIKYFTRRFLDKMGLKSLKLFIKSVKFEKA